MFLDNSTHVQTNQLAGFMQNVSISCSKTVTCKFRNMALKGVSLASVNCMMLDIVTMSCPIICRHRACKQWKEDSRADGRTVFFKSLCSPRILESLPTDSHPVGLNNLTIRRNHPTGVVHCSVAHKERFTVSGLHPDEKCQLTRHFNHVCHSYTTALNLYSQTTGINNNIR